MFEGLRRLREHCEEGTDMSSTITTSMPLPGRVDALAWDDLREQLDERGFAVTGRC